MVGVQSIQEYFKIYQLRLYGYVNRMDGKRMVKECMKQEKLERGQGDDQGKHGRKGYER
jgi:hypothetical protein